MYENSRHANWLLAMLIITLLLSGLILGWLLARPPALASPTLQYTQVLSPAEPVKAIAAIQKDAAPTTDSDNKPVTTANIKTSLPPSLLDSEQNLELAAAIPNSILPLATLVANSTTPNLPKTTAPTALSLQGLKQANADSNKTAWIYAGQYQNQQWNLVGLNIGQTTYPQVNEHYKLIWGTKLRSAPPSQRSSANSNNLADSIGYLAEGSDIQILAIKPSGKNGHIWLEISY